MTGTSGQAKGLVKKAALAPTGSKKLQREGRVQEPKGRIKEKIERGAKKIEKAIDGRGT